jgi:putative sugar O-methyltransferase
VTATKYGASDLWTYNNDTRVTPDVDLTTFKAGPANYKLALWDPGTNGMRYLKSLLYVLADRLSPENRERLRRIRNRDVGGPITVRSAGDEVCMDYLQAVHELEFMASVVHLDGMRVLEIGAGYGRTCHAMLSNHDVEYWIVDLDNALSLARRYLHAVLDDDQLARVRFVPVSEVDEALTDKRFGLCVNIDSFAEMPPDTVRNYLELADARCDALYVNNPVGKYLDPSLDNHVQGAEVVAYALRTGLLREVIDVYDSEAVAARAKSFVEAYRPGAGWACLRHGAATPWSYYRQAIYERAV